MWIGAADGRDITLSSEGARMASQLQSFRSERAGEEGSQMAAQVQSFRQVYENEITKRYLVGAFLVVLGASIIGSVFYFKNELSGFTGPLWVFIGFCVGRLGFFVCNSEVRNYENKGFSLNHTCGRHISSTTAWECGHCDHVNDPAYRLRNYSDTGRVSLFLYQCGNCENYPTAILCPECLDPVKLGHEPVFRPARVWKAPSKESGEIGKLKQELEERKEKIRHEYELERVKRSLQGETILLDLEELGQKIKSSKQFEQAALKMVEDLKAQGHLTAQEEAAIKESIQDKVMEFLYVDRHGGRTRH
jgi:hypothetical protein